MKLIYLTLLIVILILDFKKNKRKSLFSLNYHKLKRFIMGSQNEIIENLWLGDNLSSLDNNFLQSKNIKLVFNCTKDLPFTNLDIQKIRIPIEDNRSNESNEMLLEKFNEYYDLIDNNLNNGILVHCYAGCQRSATLVALYLMKKNNIMFDDAKKIIRLKRYFAFFPRINFYKILYNNSI